MKRWEEKMKQYEKESRPNFWKESKVAIVFTIALSAAILAVAFLTI